MHILILLKKNQPKLVRSRIISKEEKLHLQVNNLYGKNKNDSRHKYSSPYCVFFLVNRAFDMMKLDMLSQQMENNGITQNRVAVHKMY